MGPTLYSRTSDGHELDQSIGTMGESLNLFISVLLANELEFHLYLIVALRFARAAGWMQQKKELGPHPAE